MHSLFLYYELCSAVSAQISCLFLVSLMSNVKKDLQTADRFSAPPPQRSSPPTRWRWASRTSTPPSWWAPCPGRRGWSGRTCWRPTWPSSRLREPPWTSTPRRRWRWGRSSFLPMAIIGDWNSSQAWISAGRRLLSQRLCVSALFRNLCANWLLMNPRTAENRRQTAAGIIRQLHQLH